MHRYLLIQIVPPDNAHWHCGIETLLSTAGWERALEFDLIRNGLQQVIRTAIVWSPRRLDVELNGWMNMQYPNLLHWEEVS